LSFPLKPDFLLRQEVREHVVETNGYFNTKADRACGMVQQSQLWGGNEEVSSSSTAAKKIEIVNHTSTVREQWRCGLTTSKGAIYLSNTYSCLSRTSASSTWRMYPLPT
jgi:hypothetical protein